MTTSLQAVQRMLHNVAEEFDISTTNETVASVKARNYLEEACREVSYMYDWDWLFQVRSSSFAGSWSNKSFSFTGGGCRNLKFVKYGNEDDGYVSIPPVTQEAFYTTALNASTADAEAVPVHYTFNNNVLRVNPYPDDATTQGKIWLGWIPNFVYPLLDSQNFGMPDEFLDLAIHKALVHMAQYHTHDRSEAEFRQAQYESQLRTIMSQRRAIQFENQSFFNREQARAYGGYQAII